MMSGFAAYESYDALGLAMRSVSRCARSRGAGEGGRGQRDGGATGTESGVSVTVTVGSTPLIRRWGCFVRSGWSRMRAPWVGSYFATEVRKFSARYMYQ